MPVAMQWNRAALAVTHFMSDETADELSLISGKMLAGAVSKLLLKRMRPRNTTLEYKAQSQVCDDYLSAMMEHYYSPWVCGLEELPFDRSSWMRAIVVLMNAVGKHLIKTLGTEDLPFSDLAKEWEATLRKTLKRKLQGSMPGSVDYGAGAKAPSQAPCTPVTG